MSGAGSAIPRRAVWREYQSLAQKGQYDTKHCKWKNGGMLTSYLVLSEGLASEENRWGEQHEDVLLLLERLSSRAR